LLVAGRQLHETIFTGEFSVPSWKWRNARLWLNFDTLSKNAFSTFNILGDLVFLPSLSLLTRFDKSFLCHIFSAFKKIKEVWLSLIW
jgi:hypothetical protein